MIFLIRTNLPTMFASLTFLGILRALTIDNQLAVVRNDCYERLAIGHRLNAKDVYKKFDINTVKECQIACTKERDSCKSFSFGIGTKGNATCELGTNAIKESADLKPIGTVASADFDLYIKKLGCSLVIDSTTTKRPEQSVRDPYNGHKYPSKPNYLSRPHYNDDSDVQHVQTIVSISTGPQKPVLHPVHEILIGEGPHSDSRPNYDSRPTSYYPPRPDYGSRPDFDPYYYTRPGPGGYADIRPDISKPEYQRPPLSWPHYDFKPNVDRYVETKPEVSRPNEYNLKPNSNGYGDFNPGSGYAPSYNLRPNMSDDLRPSLYHPSKPSLDPYDSFRPNFDKPLPNRYDEFLKPLSYHGSYGSYIPHPDEYNYFSPKPNNDYLFRPDPDRYEARPDREPSYSYKPKPSRPAGSDSYMNDNNKPTLKPIITQSVGSNGESITSIITELGDACFRRVLAGKRVARGFVRRAMSCERIEDCQQECAEEKRFVCEGFNYRLDATGRGKGECELLEIPLTHLDIGRDLYPDPDYDYYERDRNAASFNCKRRPVEGGPYSAGKPDYPAYYHHHQHHETGGGYNYNFDSYYSDRSHDYGGGRWDKPPLSRPGDYDRRFDYSPSGNRRGDFSYHTHHQNYNHHQHFSDRHENFHHGTHYLPPSPHQGPIYDYMSYEPFLPPYKRPNGDRQVTKYNVDRDKDVWGFNTHSWGAYGGSYGDFGNDYESHSYKPDFNRRYLPSKANTDKYWGQYGGIYGNGGYPYNHIGENDRNFAPPPKKPNSYLPLLPAKPSFEENHFGHQHGTGHNFNNHYYNSILPLEPRKPTYDFLKDECSLRSATGFRLHKGIVKKFYSVPNIYECELLCFKERDFPCASFAFRYTVSLSAPADNCYLSDRNYKALDFYTDLQPDRDFDIYTMNNQDKCEQPIVLSKDNSECFWRVRSAQRLHQEIVRDSLTTKSIVECQIECLQATTFTCRAFSFRYGSPVIGGAIDNCQLTDWPFYELDPIVQLVPEPGFELYERGSFGHGCEPDHFSIRGGQPSKPADQLCYIGFGSPARLLPQATRKSLRVLTELDCKTECSKFREGTLFQCMSFSYRNDGSINEPNCHLSDIMQRDLLPNVDYIPDPDCWLFAWDNYNPECVALAHKPIEDHHQFGIGKNEGIDRLGYDITHPLHTWRVYSVSGWPCRRGSLCQENREAGFWFCELEGGDANTWDYCCRPDHQCGYSEGFIYQWCYVGPVRTQWRRCSDQYYPYLHNMIDRFDTHQSRPAYLPTNIVQNVRPPPYRPAARPDRPPRPPTAPPPRPSLDQYEEQFANQFLEPPKPGGFGKPRRWPVSYLHKEIPPNNTDTAPRLMMVKEESSPKFAAIQNLIDIIKSNDLKNIQYQITNNSNKNDDVLYVRIPLPATVNDTDLSQSLKLTEQPKNITRSQKSLPILLEQKNSTPFNGRSPTPIYRRSFVVRTNITNHGKRSHHEEDFV